METSSAETPNEVTSEVTPNVSTSNAQHPELLRWMHQLIESHRAVFALAEVRQFWVASEKSKDFRSIYVDASFSPEPPELPATAATPEAVLDAALLG